MAVLELTAIVVAYGAMALVFGALERAEERRILARAEAVLAREGRAWEPDASEDLAAASLPAGDAQRWEPDAPADRAAARARAGERDRPPRPRQVA